MGTTEDETRALREAVLLESDAQLIVASLTAPGPDHALDSPTPDHGNYFAVSGDLFRRCAEHSLHTGWLLQRGAFASAAVLARAAYEHALDLLYLVTQGDKIQNAVRCRARALLEVAEELPNQPSGREAREILTRMPREIVQEQRQFQKRGRGWSGLTVRQLADAVGVVGHQQGYGLLSWYAHARMAGYDVEQKQEGEYFRLTFAERSDPGHRHGLANFTRRSLHRVYGVIARDWLGRVPPLSTSDPEETRSW